MNRSFLVPTVIACSAHALLMFGFTPPERRPVEKPITICPDPLPDHFPITIEDTPEIIYVKSSDIPPLKKPIVNPQDTPASSRTSGEESSLKPDLLDNGPFKIEVETNINPRAPFIPHGGPGTPNGAPEIVYPPAALDAAPRARFQAPPAYPYALKSSGVTGEVLVEFVVDESGHVLNPRVLKSSHFEFEAPTLAAVSKWRFEPGMRNSRAVKFMMRVPVTFSIEN
jgi:periplasmic protein TonB